MDNFLNITRFDLDVEEVGWGQVDEGALLAKAVAACFFDQRLDLDIEIYRGYGFLKRTGNLIGPRGQAPRTETDFDDGLAGILGLEEAFSKAL
jgi:hypothetical protein